MDGTNTNARLYTHDNIYRDKNGKASVCAGASGTPTITSIFLRDAFFSFCYGKEEVIRCEIRSTWAAAKRSDDYEHNGLGFSWQRKMCK